MRGGRSELLKLATSRSIVLWVMVEAMDTSLGTIYCPNLLLSNFTTFAVEKGAFSAFYQAERP